eukprot:5988169-Ditylum_brightwellii.AAC.1
MVILWNMPNEEVSGHSYLSVLQHQARLPVKQPLLQMVILRGMPNEEASSHYYYLSVLQLQVALLGDAKTL